MPTTTGTGCPGTPAWPQRSPQPVHSIPITSAAHQPEPTRRPRLRFATPRSVIQMDFSSVYRSPVLPPSYSPLMLGTSPSHDEAMRRQMESSKSDWRTNDHWTERVNQR